MSELSESFEERFQQALDALENNQLDTALRLFKEAALSNPDHLESSFYLGEVAQQLALVDTALQAYQACIRIAPDCTPALINGAQLFTEQEQFGRAWEWLEQAKRSSSQNAPLENELLNETLGKFYFAQGQYARAIEIFEQLARHNPSAPEVFQNWGMALEADGRLHDAEAVLKTGLSQFPHHPPLHFHLSTVLLAQQKFQAGWIDYEWRFQSGLVPPRPEAFKTAWCTRHPNHTVNFFPNQLLKPEPHEFNLVLHEQGYGDTIQFARIFPWLIQHGYLSPEAHWIIEVPQPLLRLFQNQTFHNTSKAPSGGITWIERDQAGEIQPILSLIEKQTSQTLKAVYSLMSLPGLLPEAALFQPDAAYLTVPEVGVNNDHKELSKNHSHIQHWIGWMPSGSPSNQAGRRRSIPDEIWLPMLQRFLEPHPETGILWLSPDIPPEALSQAKALIPSKQLVCPFQEFTQKEDQHDFLETSQWLKICDQVITIDTALAHLAGALNLPTIILLPYASDWRWFLPPSNQLTTSSLHPSWYPRVQLLRQDDSAEWQTLIEKAFMANAF